MWKLPNILLLAAVIAALVISQTTGECNRCQENGVACINRTSFYVCANDVPITTRAYNCLANQECTNTLICFDEGTFDLGCGDVSSCDVCGGGPGTFACTSRNTFKMCMNDEPSGTDLICPGSQLCDPTLAAAGDIPCTLVCGDANLKICDRDSSGDEGSTTASPSTVSPSTVSPSTVSPSTVSPSTVSPTTETTTIFTPTPDPAANARTTCVRTAIAGRYANPLDTTCATFIYCYQTSTGWTGIIGTCPTGRFFTTTTRNCETTRPTGCTV